MRRCTSEDLIGVGYATQDAESLAALPPHERMKRMPIIGNAWSDSPLFLTIEEVRADPTLGDDVKWEAFARLWDATGPEPGRPDRVQDAEEFEKWLSGEEEA